MLWHLLCWCYALPRGVLITACQKECGQYLQTKYCTESRTSSRSFQTQSRLLRDDYTLFLNCSLCTSFNSTCLQKYRLYCEIKEWLVLKLVKDTPIYGTAEEKYINNYNPTILRAWQANMDIQYVTNINVVVNYILGYVTKPERELRPTEIHTETCLRTVVQGNV